MILKTFKTHKTAQPPKKIKNNKIKINLISTKKVTVITSGENKFSFFFFSDGGNWWGVTVAQNDWLPVSQTTEVALGMMDLLTRCFFWHSIIDFLQGTDESTWLWNAGPRGPSHLYMYFQIASFWDFLCKFVWFFQHFGFVLLCYVLVERFFYGFPCLLWMHIVLKPYSSLWDPIPGILFLYFEDFHWFSPL